MCIAKPFHVNRPFTASRKYEAFPARYGVTVLGRRGSKLPNLNKLGNSKSDEFGRNINGLT